MKILIAIDENKGLNSKLSLHFGHCGYFAIYETDTKEFKIVKNELNHSNQNMTPVDQIMKYNPSIIFSLGIGQRAIKLFNEKKIKVKIGDYKILKEVIENVNNLKELNNGCLH
jgi:predicted Fe-Mo cluster-binding NifX family protein